MTYMNHNLELNGDRLVYPVPEGLYELLTDITREVLRANPSCIVPFIAEYLGALQTTREAAKQAMKIVDEALENDLMKYCVNLRTSPDRLVWAVLVIQRALRAHFGRKARAKKTRGSRGWARGEPESEVLKLDVSTDLTGFLQKHRITFLQAHYAAIVIQSAWRGYQARKALKTKSKPEEGYVFADEGKYELEKYAPSWANSWLTLFEKAEPPVTPFVKGQMFPVRSPSQVFLPRREISVNRHTLQTLFYGEKDEVSCVGGSSRGSTPALSFSPRPPKYVGSQDFMDEGYMIPMDGEFEAEAFEGEARVGPSSSTLTVFNSVPKRVKSQRSNHSLPAKSAESVPKSSSSGGTPSSRSAINVASGASNVSQKGITTPQPPSSAGSILDAKQSDKYPSESEQMEKIPDYVSDSPSEYLEVTEATQSTQSAHLADQLEVELSLSQDEYRETDSELLSDIEG